MADEIKQKITLEGEKQYSAALKEANRTLKTLRSELKAESAELGNNASAQAKNEVKARSLRKQIEQQEKVVNTLKSALKDAKDRYGDNSEEVAKWEQKLNGARYTLATMNNALEQSENALKGQGDALKDSAGNYEDAANAASEYADAVGAAGATADSVTFQGIMTAADNLTEKLKGALTFITNLGKAAWEWMSDSGEWADTLSTEAQEWGVSRETLQGWRYASRFVDTEVETIGNAFKKLTNRSDATNKKLKELGIVADSGVGAQDLFWQVIESMEALDDTAKENTANEIFGTKFQKLMPLINAGRDAWEGYVEEAEKSGYVLDDDQVDKLGAFDDANQKLQASFEAMQHTIAAELAPAFTEVSNAMSGLITSFTEWAKTEQGQKTLGDLGNALKDLVESFTGEQNFTGLVEGATKAVEGLTGALEWIKDNKALVVGGIGGIGAALGALTISKDVLSALMLIRGFKWFGGGNKAPTAAPTQVPGAEAAAAGGSLLSKIGGASGVAGLAGLSAIIAGGYAAIHERRTNEEIRGSERAIEVAASSEGDALGKAFVDYVSAQRELQDLFTSPEYTDEKASALMDAVDAAKGTFEGMEGYQEVMKAYSDWLQENSYGSDSWELPDDIPTGWFSDVLDSMTWENTGLTSEDVSGFQSLPGDIEAAVASGIASGTSGMSISMDGAAVGRVVAPYVSQAIASQMIM